MELSSPADIDDAAELFLRNINVAAEYSMLGQLPSPPSPAQPLLKPEILDLVRHKRALRRQYMRSRNPLDLRDFRRAAYELRKLLFVTKSKYFQDMLRYADPNKNYGFNLWKATRCVKRQPLRRIPIKRPDNTWCRSDAEIVSVFADELEGRFTPFALASPSQVQDTETFLKADLDPVQPITPIAPGEVRLQIRRLKSTKAPGYDGIDGRVAKALPEKGVMFLVLLFNSVVRIHHFATQGSFLGPALYTLYTADLPIPVARNTLLATYADDTVFLANSTTAWRTTAVTRRFLDGFSTWANRWNICVNGSKFQHCTFALRHGNCPTVRLNNMVIPQENHVRYLGMFLDRKLTWRKHIHFTAAACR
ncbi:GH17529 [Drosophila grimshawi]|uniref:GH17529 n=1 Tax=Drosophila grimshawi TaxID=7222 RepID=B4K1E4_DROGR|nr:GH17529 [Drosophila grimshawi]